MKVLTLAAGANKKVGIVQHMESYAAKRFQGKYVSLRFEAKTTALKVISNLRAAVISYTGRADSLGDILSDIKDTFADTNPTWSANYTMENTPANLALTTDYTTFTIENIYIDTASINNLSVAIWMNDINAAENDEFYIKNVSSTSLL